MSKLRVFYNEIDQFCCAWISNLMDTGLITPGVIDDRSIEDLNPDDLRGYDRAHFFAGIAVWDYALNNAHWPDDSPTTWTGSCPCQGFSASGQRGGFSDKRHLWPTWFRLIRESRPVVIFGEQVASKDGLAWFDVVSSDMEGEGYTIGAVDSCAAGVGAPHIRQRLYFVADSNSRRRESRREQETKRTIQIANANGRLGDPEYARFDSPNGKPPEQGGNGAKGRLPERANLACELAQPNGAESSNGELQRSGRLLQPAEDPLAGFWRNAEWIYCRDGKYRPVESGTFPLAHGITKRVGKLRGFGNALCAPQAQAFIEAYLSL